MVWAPKINKLKKNHLYKKKVFTANKNKLSNNKVFYYGIKCLESGYINANQIECVRKVIVRILRLKKFIGQSSSFKFRIFPHISITKKSKGVRMGNGKGSHHLWVAALNSGKIILEFEGLNSYWAYILFEEIKVRLSLKTKLIHLN